MKRFRVRIDAPDGGWEVVTVWAANPDEAHRQVVGWADRSQDRSLSTLPFTVEEIGDAPAGSDLGIAATDAAVEHHMYAFNGTPVGTPFSVDREQIARATVALRTGQGPAWDRLRTALHGWTFFPKRVALVAPAWDGDGPPIVGIVVQPDGQAMSFRRYEDVGDEPGGTITPLWVHPDQIRREIAYALQILSADPGAGSPWFQYLDVVRFWLEDGRALTYRIVLSNGGWELAIALATRRVLSENHGTVVDVDLLDSGVHDEGGENARFVGDVELTDDPPPSGRALPNFRWTVRFVLEDGEATATQVITHSFARAVAVATVMVQRTHGDAAPSEVEVTLIEPRFDPDDGGAFDPGRITP